MPYTIAWKTRGILWTFYGVLTGEDAMQANLDIYGDPRFDDLLYQIVDLSAVERFMVTPEDLDTAAALDDAATVTKPRLVVAVIAAKRDALTVAELYKSAMRVSRWKVRVFDSMEEARKWIQFACGMVVEDGQPDR